MTGMLVLLLILATVTGTQAAEYCSLAVRVLSPSGKRVLETYIAVQEKGRQAIARDVSLDEDATFCDLGIAPVTVTVGFDTCNQVIVRDVPIRWQEPYLLTVTYDPMPCLIDSPPPLVPACQVLLRVSDLNNKWIEKAVVQFREPPMSQLTTDRAGRAYMVLNRGRTFNGSVEAHGYSAQRFSFSCSQFELLHEEHVRLQRSEVP